jgi:hypothetical protein
MNDMDFKKKSHSEDLELKQKEFAFKTSESTLNRAKEIKIACISASAGIIKEFGATKSIAELKELLKMSQGVLKINVKIN